ncbi:smf Mn2+ and Fe2+ transporter [Amylostereum chailletii]|nr:smf Mn2+ and Fe2+ transporter [Amylostereum chailletii]
MPSSDAIPPPSSSPPSPSWALRLRTCAHVIWDHLSKHTGVGIVCAVAYFDPGNWGVDLQAGSDFGYKLLFVVLLSGLFAVFLQVRSLASKLGIVTGLDLASHCRLLLYSRTNHPRTVRWLTLYPLYVFSEIAIVSTDLAELLGSAIALNLLFPRLPLWAGVLITASDVFLILAIGDPLQGRPVKMFELFIGALVIAVLICMCIIISKVGVDWGDAFYGFVPSKAIFEHGGLYTSVGILGATVMPHSLFLGSALSTQDRASIEPLKPLSHTLHSSETVSTMATPQRFTLKSLFKSFFGYTTTETRAEPRNHTERENSSFAFVKAHLNHGIADIVISLLGLAVVINSLILILAGAAFHDGDGSGTSNLFEAHALINRTIGSGAGVTFALALLCSGQSASIVATVAGQIVSEGFLRWRVSPIFRRFLTRLLGLIPSMIVAIAVGKDGVDTMLVASQVVLSIVLPFIILPLVWLTSSKTVMRVRLSPPLPLEHGKSNDELPASGTLKSKDTHEVDAERDAEDRFIDFSNGWIAMVLGYAIWLLVVVANGYVIITLILGA